MSDTSLFGRKASLDDLFEHCEFFEPGCEPDGYFPFHGLPGSVDLDRRRILYAKPHPHIREAVAKQCICGALGGFRSARSAFLMREGLLPVIAYDLLHTATIDLAQVPYAEHERYAG